MTAGQLVYAAIVKMAAENNIPTVPGGKVDETKYPNDVVVSYDPADSRTDPGCSEFIYVYRGKEMMAEGFVMPDGGSAWYRVNMEDENERPMFSADALAGFMFARLLEVLALPVRNGVAVEHLKTNDDGSRTWEVVRDGFRSEGDASGWIMAALQPGGELEGSAYNEVRAK